MAANLVISVGTLGVSMGNQYPNNYQPFLSVWAQSWIAQADAPSTAVQGTIEFFLNEDPTSVNRRIVAQAKAATEADAGFIAAAGFFDNTSRYLIQGGFSEVAF